jgi:hypothetical protein
MLLRPRSVRKLELIEMIGDELNSAMIGFADAIGLDPFQFLVWKSPHVRRDRSGPGCRTAANSPIEKPRSIFLRFSIISTHRTQEKVCRGHRATQEKEVGFLLGFDYCGFNAGTKMGNAAF